MKPFLDEDFLLTTNTARELYHGCAKKQPIFDYHCHLDPRELRENIAFPNVGRLMLGGDHYKWRAMRSNGEAEPLDPAHSSDWERFLGFARTLKYAIGNPLYHWTHLELKRVFGIDEPLTEDNARAVWDACNALLAKPEYRCQSLVKRFDVRVLCTTDDPADTLEHHAALAADKNFSTRVLPTFRPDKALGLEKPDFRAYAERLSAASGVEIRGFDDMMAALEKRLDFFHALGARVSDHGLDEVPVSAGLDPDAALRKALAGEETTPEERASYKVAALTALGRMYEKRGWTMQIHMNALRNNNTRAFERYGADIGFDSVNDTPVARPLSRLLDGIECAGGLPKVILYCLNPAANYAVGSMIGNYQRDMPGKIQMGSGWWFCDQRDGMVEQIRTLAALGLLGRFVGMLTDSRSFISYPRHEYFRRILCDQIGRWVENGEYPADGKTLRELVAGICFENARAYFGIDL